MTVEMEHVGNALRAHRLDMRLSRRELAKKAKLTHATISNIENNRTSPSLATLARILDVVGLTFADFFSLSLPSSAKIFYQRDEMMVLSKGDFEILQVGQGRGGGQ